MLQWPFRDKIVEEVSEDLLQPGDHVKCDCTKIKWLSWLVSYEHHAIYMGNGRYIQNTLGKDTDGKYIKIEDVNAFFKNAPIKKMRRVQHNNCLYSAKKILQRAKEFREKYGHRIYCLPINNCEYFISMVYYNHYFSKQVLNVLIQLLLGGLLIASIVYFVKFI